VAPEAVKAAAAALVNAKSALIIYGPLAARGEQGKLVRTGLQNLAGYTGHGERLAYVGLDANSQGCRDQGVLPDRLPGHASLDDATARTRLEQLWGTVLPTQPGKTYSQMLNAAGNAIKALFIMGADPASERPTWAANLDKVDFLVVQDLFLTETAQKADVVLPAVSWAEQDGTFTNLEGRVQRAVKALGDPQSKAAPDWMILDHLASYFDAQWVHASAQSVTAEITQANPLYAGLDWSSLGDQGAQWAAASLRGAVALEKIEQPELPTAEQGLRLIGGAVLFDGGNLFHLTKQMQGLAASAAVALNPADVAGLGVAEGDRVTVRNSYGSVSVAVKIDPTVKAGSAWIPESSHGAPVGALVNGGESVSMWVEK
jgi:predicted molibdopterin-dependent oxidoreductase YjgC